MTDKEHKERVQMIESKIREILVEQECTFDEAIKRITVYVDTQMSVQYLNGYLNGKCESTEQEH